MAKKPTTYNPTQHMLVPKHTKLSQKETKELFSKYGLSFINLPKISADDPAIRSLKMKAGEIVKVERKSPTAGHSIYYRGVSSE